MAKFYTKETHASHEGAFIIFIGYLILGSIMAYFYPLVCGESTMIQSLLFGGLIGILWVFPHGVAMARAHGTSLSYVVKNGAWHLIEQGFGGVLIWIVLRF